MDTTPMDLSEFVPRAVAPEGSASLKELREVANSSARSAIDKHQKKRLEQLSYVFGFVAIVTFMVGATMACWARSLVSVPSLLATLSILGCVVTGLRAFSFSAKARACGEPSHEAHPVKSQPAALAKGPIPTSEASPEIAYVDESLGAFPMTQDQVAAEMTAAK
jgi:hypothetical protein